MLNANRELVKATLASPAASFYVASTKRFRGRAKLQTVKIVRLGFEDEPNVHYELRVSNYDVTKNDWVALFDAQDLDRVIDIANVCLMADDFIELPTFERLVSGNE